MKIIPVIFASDNGYLPYLATTILSLAETSNPDNKYEIWVLEQGIDIFRQKLVKDSVKQYSNIEINFFNIDNKVAEIGEQVFYTTAHFSKAVYYRLFIPEIFTQYEKVLYLDSDILILKDVAELYDTEIGDNLIGAARDLIAIYFALTSNDKKEYITNTLGIKDIYSYIQSGILIMNLTAMRNFNLTQKSLEKLREVGTPHYVDQDILSSVCQKHTFYLSEKWNYYWHEHIEFDGLMDNVVPKNMMDSLYDARKEAYIVHYASHIKPWNSPQYSLSNIWWKYARMIPFYEEILFVNLKPKIVVEEFKKVPKFKKLKYRILSKITFGKMRKKYKNKYKKSKRK